MTPPREPLDTAELQAFVQTVDSGSISAAAADLGLPRATVGRRLARLEERLGARLLSRTTRTLALTDAGQALDRHARIVLDAARDAEAVVHHADGVVRGELRVSVPTHLGGTFHAFIADFATRYPDVRLQVHASNVHVDLRRDGYDVALRAGSELEPGLVARTVARMDLVAVAAPAYLDARGAPDTPAALRDHRCLMSFARGATPRTHWPLVAGGQIAVAGALFSNSLALAHELALRGHGVALLPAPLVAGDLRAGRLAPVLAGILGEPTRVSVVYLERQLLPPQVRVFVDALVAWAQVALLPDGAR